jgi:hypothetical protein
MAVEVAFASFRSDGIASVKVVAKFACARLVAKATNRCFTRLITDRADAPAARRSGE